MSFMTWIAILLLLLIILILFFVLRTLNRIAVKLSQHEKPADDAIHDTLHPVFSARQLRLARQCFEDRHKTLFQLEKQLYGSEAWLNHHKSSDLSLGLRQQLRQVCEALVEVECSWKEYAFMISGNVAVANRGESGRSVIEAFGTLLEETRGIAAENFVAPNHMKLQRVNAWLEDWVVRLGSSPVKVGPDEHINVGIKPIRNELFQEVWEDREEWRTPFR